MTMLNVTCWYASVKPMLDLESPLDIWERFRKQRHNVLKVSVIVGIKFLIWEYFLRFMYFPIFLQVDLLFTHFSPEN